MGGKGVLCPFKTLTAGKFGTAPNAAVMNKRCSPEEMKVALAVYQSLWVISNKITIYVCAMGARGAESPVCDLPASCCPTRLRSASAIVVAQLAP